jgi:hypothetical protein
MACTVKIIYDAIGIAGTPSAGTNYLNQVYSIDVPNGDFIGEMIADGAGFSSCPGVTQYIFRARNAATGQVVGFIKSSTCHNLQFKSYTNSCPPTPPDDSLLPHDCINGACIKKSVYSTPGLYPSLSACQVACGSKGCSGQCVSSADWAQIEGLSNQLKNRNCG